MIPKNEGKIKKKKKNFIRWVKWRVWGTNLL